MHDSYTNLLGGEKEKSIKIVITILMLQVIRKAIASSFNTLEMIRIAGDQSLNEQASQLASLEESYRLKRIFTDEYESKKVNLIVFSIHLHQHLFLLHLI